AMMRKEPTPMSSICRNISFQYMEKRSGLMNIDLSINRYLPKWEKKFTVLFRILLSVQTITARLSGDHRRNNELVLKLIYKYGIRCNRDTVR
ncbi:MAG: hypothetical protein ACI959_001969, partial [Limisphaerales bacterium]